jgi:hypothetical protein
VGWQARDWAKLDDTELGTLYGGGGNKQEGPSTVMRMLMWSAIVLVAALGGFYILSRPSGSSSGPPRPVHLYGHAITFGGMPSVCTQIAYNTALSGWVCDRIQNNSDRLPVIEPVPYQGPCTDAVADQTGGHWVCQGNTPISPADLPSVLMYAPDVLPVPARGNA